jgi:hypothetical protein
VGALERVKRLGFSPRVRVTYHYEGGPMSFRLDEMLEEAMHESKNLPYNRLVQLAGFDALNGPRGTLKRAGLEQSYIIRAYEVSAWTREGHSKWFKSTPKITLREGRRKRTIKARTSKTKYPCYGAACASMSDLAKMMCSMMLHEQLPASVRLQLGGDGEQGPHLRVLRRAMNERRRRGKDDVWDAFKKAFPSGRGYTIYRKAGFSEDWLSDNIYLYHSRSRVRWIVSLAGYPGRGALAKAAQTVAGIIADDAL